MKRTVFVCLLMSPALVAVLALTSCSSASGPEGQGATVVATQPGVPGGVMINTYQITATVKAIDTKDRKVTLEGGDGKDAVVECGPEVVNFPQIQVGDQVKATVTEQLVVFMAKNAPPQTDGAATAVALAPVGAKPGGVVAQTVQVTAKVAEIDLKNHRATLEFPDGSKKTFAVRPDVDLTQRAIGEEVVIRATESVAISVEKP
jgi:Cu/Ag efflux protein CusF